MLLALEGIEENTNVPEILKNLDENSIEKFGFTILENL